MCFDKKIYKSTRECTYRMKWVDYSTLLLINKEGVEKLVNIDNNFEEVAYNQRPHFTPEEEEIVS